MGLGVQGASSGIPLGKVHQGPAPADRHTNCRPTHLCTQRTPTQTADVIYTGCKTARNNYPHQRDHCALHPLPGQMWATGVAPGTYRPAREAARGHASKPNLSPPPLPPCLQNGGTEGCLGEFHIQSGGRGTGVPALLQRHWLNCLFKTEGMAWVLKSPRLTFPPL